MPAGKYKLEIAGSSTFTSTTDGLRTCALHSLCKVPAIRPEPMGATGAQLALPLSMRWPSARKSDSGPGIGTVFGAAALGPEGATLPATSPVGSGTAGGGELLTPAFGAIRRAADFDICFAAASIVNLVDCGGACGVTLGPTCDIKLLDLATGARDETDAPGPDKPPASVIVSEALSDVGSCGGGGGGGGCPVPGRRAPTKPDNKDLFPRGAAPSGTFGYAWEPLQALESVQPWASNGFASRPTSLVRWFKPCCWSSGPRWTVNLIL
mmetsp:Transcript_148957/g.371138  ORF Transcript_148957/g.371138 Transcript_148957/m.371138 type:complete len:267 (-) Transcript_148957:572-1372(-)